MSYEYYTLASFYMNGQHMTMKITREEEEKDLQNDPEFPGITLCLASNAYWALCTLQIAGKIEKLEFQAVRVLVDDDSEE